MSRVELRFDSRVDGCDFISEPDLSNTVHAFDFLKSPSAVDSAIIVVFGLERFLKIQVIQTLCAQFFPDGEDDINLIRISGKEIEFKDLLDEIDTVSLFGDGVPRLIVLEDADNFVSANRKSLTDYIQSPNTRNRLILDVGTWPANTNLYKLIDKQEFQIDCRPPHRGKAKSPDAKAIAKWASSWARQRHGLKIKPVVIEHMTDLCGLDLGVIDQNLAKLALYRDPKTDVTEEDVDQYIGGWQTRTIWDLIDCALDGQTGIALTHLNRLIQNGEAPHALFGQIAWSLRRFAIACDEANRYSRARRPLDVDTILANSGFRHYEKSKVLGQLKRIGRKKGAGFHRLLLETDMALKSSHSDDDRARIAIEKLIMRLVD